MENPSPLDPTLVSNENSMPSASAPVPTANQNLNLFVVLAILVSGVVFGLAGYYLGSQKYQPLSRSESKIDVTESPVPVVTEVSKQPTKQLAIGNMDMIAATKVTSPVSGYKAWLDGNGLSSTQLWVEDKEGIQQLVLVADLNAEGTIKLGEYDLISPVWSPDGTQIVYIKNVYDSMSKLDITSRKDIYVIKRDGTFDQLLESGAMIAVGSYGKTDLEWTADGISYTEMSSPQGTKKMIKL